jgi:DNA-directed RNA polymerase subunit RPC12/RpoP
MTFRELEFVPGVACDRCGLLGSWDVMGDYLCPDCMREALGSSDDDEKYYEED